MDPALEAGPAFPGRPDGPAEAGPARIRTSLEGVHSPAGIAARAVSPVRAGSPGEAGAEEPADADERAPGAGRPGGSDPPAAGGCPAQLPPELAGFVGRTPELDWLHALLPAAGVGPQAAGALPPAVPVSPIALITGTAGVGKTALAIRFARQAGPLFPDGQLYVNLRGFDPAGAPMPPGTALQWFFDALGVPAQQVPADLDARSALLRTRLAGRRMLLLLDNAHDADQVRPLLPGSGGCMVLVTSRSQLTGLVVAGARPLPLDVLGPADAAALVAGRLGAARTAAEADAVTDLVRHSAGLPLALSVTCARAASRPAMRLADLATELGDARGRLDALRTGEASTDLRAVFSWSADKLSPAASRMFRLLGLHAGPDIAVPAAASLAAVPVAEARSALAELTRASLLSEDAAGRFGCHDLLRAYAAELAAGTLEAAELEAAGHRVLDHYLRTAHAATARLFPGHGRIELPAAVAGVTAEQFRGPGAYDAALAWYSAEHRVLRALIEWAAAQRHDEHCWKLAWCWASVLYRCGRVHEVLAAQQTAVLAAGRLGDRDALAHVHYELGRVAGIAGDHAAADEHLRQALDLFTDLGDQPNVGMCRYGLGALFSQQERYDEALEHAMEALRLRRKLADQASVASTENAVGWILANTGQPEAGLWYCRRALDMHREAGSRTGVADTLDSMAFTHGQLGDYPRALAASAEALALYQTLGDSNGTAISLRRRGDLQLAAGDVDAARDSWEQALTLLAQVPGASAGSVGRLSAGLPAPR
jgi:tetratricopeptide (TPR) repeat protein